MIADASSAPATDKRDVLFPINRAGKSSVNNLIVL